LREDKGAAAGTKVGFSKACTFDSSVLLQLYSMLLLRRY